MMRKWDIAICIILLFNLGLFPDICYYYLRDEWDCIGEISRGMAGFFLPMGITYETASGKIMNLAGVIITVVGLIISTYMNLMQRLEKNDYGITYKEMQDPKEYPIISHILSCTRIGSYFAPILLIFVLNFGLCFTGYVLYLFCWLSVFLQVRQYAECLKEEKASERVVKAVLRSLPDAEEWRENDIQQLDIKLDEMSNGIQKARSWSKVNGVFEAFAEKMVHYAPRNQTILSELFCRHFCCGQDDPQMPVRHMWNLYLSYYNQERCSDVEIENHYAFFWGMVCALLSSMDSDDICRFIDDVLNLRKQGIEVCGTAIKNEQNKEGNKEEKIRSHNIRLELKKVKIRSAMILILLEDRLGRENIMTVKMAKHIIRLKKYGDEIFLQEDDVLKLLSDNIINFMKDMSEWNRLKAIIVNLCMDQQFCWHKCYVNSYVDVL